MLNKSTRNQALASTLWLWVSAALSVSILPLLPHIAWWIPLLGAAIIYWRFSFKQQESPSKILKLMVVALSVGVLVISYTKVFSLEGFVSLLTLTACLKIIELNTPRDYCLLVFLGCFISACQLLFSSDMLWFAYTLLCFVLFHWCLLLLYTRGQLFQQFRLESIKKVLVIFCQALPIAVVLFLVMPRIGSLWKVPLNSDTAKTGVSDSLSAGDIGNLNQDYSVAMRVTFKQADIPATSDLYWRGVLLADFDGKTWRRNLSPSISSPLNNTQKGLLATAINARSKPIYSYQIILEATGRQWLYGLNTLSVNNDKTTQLQDYTLVKTRPVVSRFQYDADSYPNVILSGQLSDQQKSVYTQLPQTEQSTSTAQLDNPRSLDYAKDLRRKYADPEEFIGALMQRFNEKFSYTLSPGKFSQTNAIDDFLFNQQRGYCEHFASSTAFLLRAAGIPARIAVGYQGGQWSNDKKYLQITQADAHAWVEVWIAGKGWKRLDPTAAVAPERVELGARSFLQSIAVHDSLANRFRHSGMMQQLGLRWDNVNYQWHRWVLGYNDQIQFSVVKGLLGGLDAWRIGALIFSILFIMILPLLLTFYWPRPREKPAKIFYCLTKLDKKLAKVGLQRESGETLSAFLDRACEMQIEHRDALAKICREANRLLYKHSSNVQSADCEGLARLINRLKIK